MYDTSEHSIEDVLDAIDSGQVTVELALEQERARDKPRVTLVSELERRQRAAAPTGPWQIAKGFNVPTADDPFGMGERFEPQSGPVTAADLPDNIDTAWLIEAGCLVPIENAGGAT